MMNADKLTLPVSMLAPAIEPGLLGFKYPAELEVLSKTTGQGLAVETLEFGLQMKG